MKKLLILSLLILMSYWGYLTYQEARAYEEVTRSIATSCDTHGLVSERIDEFTSIISLGLVKNKTKMTLDTLHHQQQKAKEKSQRYLYYFMATLALFLLLLFSCTLRGATIALSLASLIALFYGLINPILMVTIHKQVEYFGDIILSFESKGIIGSIVKLYESGETAIALTILLFSLLLPLVKSLVLTLTLLFYQHPWSHTLVAFFKQIGKWSMIDVFVVATFLVYLTSDGGGVSHAEIQVGLYFFLTYVFLSMITALLTQKVLEQKG